MLLTKNIRYVAISLAIALLLAGCSTKNPPVKSSVSGDVETVKSESTETENPMAKIATLKLSTPKSQYNSNEPVPVELTTNVGKFNLPIEKSVVVGVGAFSGLIVKDANGKRMKPYEILKPKRVIKKIYQDESLKRCVQGMMLAKNETVSASLVDLRKFYSLEPGKYSLQVAMRLKVYEKNFLDEKPPAIAELEWTIIDLKSDTKLADAAKKDAIESIKKDIAYLESKLEKTENDQKYLPLTSLRGRAELKSNTIEITISSPMSE